MGECVEVYFEYLKESSMSGQRQVKERLEEIVADTSV